MENGPFEDVFPIQNEDIPIAMLVYQRVSKIAIQTVDFQKTNSKV